MTEDYKGKLQAFCQKNGFSLPTYHTEKLVTPHQPMWVVTVDYANRLPYEGTPITGTKLRSL